MLGVAGSDDEEYNWPVQHGPALEGCVIQHVVVHEKQAISLQEATDGVFPIPATRQVRIDRRDVQFRREVSDALVTVAHSLLHVLQKIAAFAA